MSYTRENPEHIKLLEEAERLLVKYDILSFKNPPIQILDLGDSGFNIVCFLDNYIETSEDGLNYISCEVHDCANMLIGPKRPVEKAKITGGKNILVINNTFMNTGIRELDLSEFSLSSVLTLRHAFYGCDKLETITFNKNSDTSNIMDISFMFLGCKSLKYLDLSMFDTSNIHSYSQPFSGCISLKSIKLSKSEKLLRNYIKQHKPNIEILGD